ncbi:MAG: hypothetical protein LBR12_01510 [Opitutaceae bacterium]|jgi:hypothetical protein|nr:hypothetical protein [Opitutaceae bacterium]
MRFDDLLAHTAMLPCFDFALLFQIEPGSRASLKVQLSRWIAQGKLLPLRRGMYCLAEPFAHVPRNPAALSALLYAPSYLSDRWALGFYDLIPERVSELTAVTTRVPRRFENALGVFSYRHLKNGAFFGYHQTTFAGGTLLVAEPEKALLDHWHLSTGEWTPARLGEMRYQNTGVVDAARLLGYAERAGRPRLLRAAKTWLALRDNEGDNTIGTEEIP